jgi:hypothetical protein
MRSMGAVTMRTEREIKARLARKRRDMKKKPNFWTILVAQAHEEILMWVLNPKRKRGQHRGE